MPPRAAPLLKKDGLSKTLWGKSSFVVNLTRPGLGPTRIHCRGGF